MLISPILVINLFNIACYYISKMCWIVAFDPINMLDAVKQTFFKI
jgi:hypothetical protein